MSKKQKKKTENALTQSVLPKPVIDGKTVRWGAIVPLIGGLAVANKIATGEDPTFIISYPPFAGNDSHCVKYFSKTPYIVVDPETNILPNAKDPIFANIDFVTAVPPCAGLSMLNSNTNGSSKARGGDAVQNDWLYKTSRLVLEQIKPRVHWGENAPGLYTNMGIKVVETLRAIGKEFGYSFSMMKTDTFLHGIPQHRMRTFFFFWKDSEAPLLGYHQRKTPLLEEYLDQIPEGATHMDQSFGLGNLADNPWFLFAKSKDWSVKKLTDSRYKTMLHWLMHEGYMDDFLKFGEERGDASISKFINHVKKKMEMHLGWWDGSPLIFGDATNAIIAKNSLIVRPGRERGITLREAMHLMGLPHDFELATPAMNHICQNVPVMTATDFTFEVVRFLKGEIQDFGGEYVKQNNISRRLDYNERNIKTKVLF